LGIVIASWIVKDGGKADLWSWVGWIKRVFSLAQTMKKIKKSIIFFIVFLLFKEKNIIIKIYFFVK